METKVLTKYSEELDNIYGLGEARETLRDYFEYIQLKQSGQIQDIGNYNLFIKVSENYVGTNRIIELITNALKDTGIVADNYYEVTQKEITTKLSKIDSDLILLSDKVNFNMLSTLDILPQYIKNNSDKIFIVAYTPTIPKKAPKLSPIEEVTDGLFSWKIEIEGNYTKEEKQQYIYQKLEQNHIKVSEKCNIINELIKLDISKMDSELLYLCVKCKANNVRTINDQFLQKVHRGRYLMKTQSSGKSAMQELDELIGLEDIKAQIKQIVNYVKLNKERGQLPMLHMCFLGNAGCGKTEVAKLVAKIFQEEHILDGGLVEATRADLVGGYIGQTAIKTKEIITKALGKTLFIDERLFPYSKLR